MQEHLKDRNWAIYELRRTGATFVQLGKWFDRTAATMSSICAQERSRQMAHKHYIWSLEAECREQDKQDAKWLRQKLGREAHAQKLRDEVTARIG